MFTSQSAAMFYDRLFSSLDFTLPGAATGRRGFPKAAMVCAFIVMKCEGFTQITDLMDYLDNNRIIAHYCGFNIMEPLPSYWTYDRFLRQLNNGALKSIMADLVRELYELGIVDASFIGLDSTPVMANTKQNNPKSFAKSKFSKENHPKSDPDCALGVHSASNQHNERRYEFYWGYKSHVLVDCVSGLRAVPSACFAHRLLLHSEKIFEKCLRFVTNRHSFTGKQVKAGLQRYTLGRESQASITVRHPMVELRQVIPLGVAVKCLGK